MVDALIDRLDFETWPIPGDSPLLLWINFGSRERLFKPQPYRGAISWVKVEGKWDDSYMKSIEKPTPLK